MVPRRVYEDDSDGTHSSSSSAATSSPSSSSSRSSSPRHRCAAKKARTPGKIGPLLSALLETRRGLVFASLSSVHQPGSRKRPRVQKNAGTMLCTSGPQMIFSWDRYIYISAIQLLISRVFLNGEDIGGLKDPNRSQGTPEAADWNFNETFDMGDVNM